MVRKGNISNNLKTKIMKSNYYLKLVFGAILISAIYSFFRLISGEGVTLNSSGFLWGLLSNFLIVSVLGYYTVNSTLKGVKLAFSVFLIYFIIGCLNILIEAYIFDVTGRAETLNVILQGFFVALFFAPIFVYLLDKWKGESIAIKFEKRGVFSWLWRVPLSIFLYLIFYISAGMILQMSYPALMDFYSDKIPPADVMILTQFPRGLLFVIITVLIIRTLQLSFIKKAILVGLVFSILGGIAPLIPPNDFMPTNIRFVHGIEVGISNFLYGFIISYLLGQGIEKVELN